MHTGDQIQVRFNDLHSDFQKSLAEDRISKKGFESYRMVAGQFTNRVLSGLNNLVKQLPIGFRSNFLSQIHESSKPRYREHEDSELTKQMTQLTRETLYEGRDASETKRHFQELKRFIEIEYQGFSFLETSSRSESKHDEALFFAKEKSLKSTLTHFLSKESQFPRLDQAVEALLEKALGADNKFKSNPAALDQDMKLFKALKKLDIGKQPSFDLVLIRNNRAEKNPKSDEIIKLILTKLPNSSLIAIQKQITKDAQDPNDQIAQSLQEWQRSIYEVRGKNIAWNSKNVLIPN